MLASKFCQLQHVLPRAAKASSSLYSNCTIHVKQPVSGIQRSILYRTFADDAKESMSKAGRRRTLKETVMQPAGDTAIKIGNGAIAGAAAFGVGALCFYGLGLSSKPGAIDESIMWPQYVRDRIHATYMYFGSSVAITAASAVAVFRTPVLLNLATKNGFLAMAATLAAMLGTSMIAQGIPYKPGFGAKQLAWMTHCAVMGGFLAPMCFLGGPLLIKAAWLTAGIAGGLSAVAVCAPSDKFLTMSGPLAIGLGVVFASSIGSAFLPPTTALGSGLYAMSIYGGLILFSAFLLYDTQKIIYKAEHHPVFGGIPFDPVNASMGIYMDTLNIFIRIATILANNNQRKR